MHLFVGKSFLRQNVQYAHYSGTNTIDHLAVLLLVHLFPRSTTNNVRLCSEKRKNTSSNVFVTSNTENKCQRIVIAKTGLNKRKIETSDERLKNDETDVSLLSRLSKLKREKINVSAKREEKKKKNVQLSRRRKTRSQTDRIFFLKRKSIIDRCLKNLQSFSNVARDLSRCSNRTSRGFVCL